jgi:hypothetical protein
VVYWWGTLSTARWLKWYLVLPVLIMFGPLIFTPLLYWLWPGAASDGFGAWMLAAVGAINSGGALGLYVLAVNVALLDYRIDGRSIEDPNQAAALLRHVRRYRWLHAALWWLREWSYSDVVGHVLGAAKAPAAAAEGRAQVTQESSGAERPTGRERPTPAPAHRRASNAFNTHFDFTTAAAKDVGSGVVAHFTRLGYTLTEERDGEWAFRRRGSLNPLMLYGVRACDTFLTVRSSVLEDGGTWIACDWEVDAPRPLRMYGFEAALEAEALKLQAILMGQEG